MSRSKASNPPGLLDSLRAKAAALQRETLALWYAMKHPRTPLAAKMVAAVVVAYAVSPIDLIPDFIPVLGILDDLVLLPLGIALCIKLLPDDVMAECRERARESAERPRNPAAAVVIVAIWIALLVMLGIWLKGVFGL